MELRSEQSSEDNSIADVLMHMAHSKPAAELKLRKDPQPPNEDPDLEDQISMAADEDQTDPQREIEEEAAETLDDQRDFDPVLTEKLYRRSVFAKTSNEEILLLTSLFVPISKTQAYYDKLNQIERVCKTSSNINEYHSYLRSQREYQAQLSRFFTEKRIIDNYCSIEDDLMIPKKDYQKRILAKRLKALNSMINTLEVYTPSLDAPFSVSEKQFYDIKNSDFTRKIVWKENSKNDASFGFSKIVKGNEADKGMIFINYNEKEEKGIGKTLVFESGDFDIGKSDSVSKFSSISSRFNKVSLEFSKKTGRPGKIEVKKQIESNGKWGTVLGEKRERSENFFFTVKRRKFLFSESFDYIPKEAPTNINKFYKEPFWKDLVFNREIHKLKERYGKLVKNILDVNNSQIKEQELSDEGNNSDYDGPENDFESRLEKSAFSDSSVLGAKHAEQSIQSKVTTLKHAAPAYDYPFIKTEWEKLELRRFHRPEVSLAGLRFKLKLSSQIQIETRGEVVASPSILSSAKQLSLKEGGFLLLEYLEQRPLLLNNFGMASKIRRYYLGCKKNLEDYPKYIGKLGLAENIDSNKQFPLIGNLTEGSGMAVLENNLFRVPLYCQDPKHTDFLLIKYKKHNQKFIWYMRDIDNLCTSGQIEPKLEVMAPNARNTNSFQQKRIQAFIYNALLSKDNKIDLREVSQHFTSINEGTIRKHMKNINCEQQPDGSWICSSLPSKQEVKEKITPEEICQYESMLAGQRRLKDKGVKITSIDKVPNAIQKLKKEMDNKEISYLADFIEEELTITPWNLTSSYLKTKGEKGMMRITGVGDPTHGNCGFSFVRLPMKLPNLEKPSTKNDPSNYLPTNMAVTGSDADLRTLTKEDVRKLLLKMGCAKEDLEKIGRWSGVAMLRNLASQKVSEGYEGNIKKYARGIRLSTKMQKEQCQNTIDEIFMKQIKMLGEKREYGSEKGSDSEDEYLTRRVAENINKGADEKVNRYEEDSENEDTERKKLKEFKSITSGFNNAPVSQGKTGTRKVLRRLIKIRNLKGQLIYKTLYITDLSEIEEYYKKKKEEEDQPNIKEKNQKAAETIRDKILKIEKGKKKKEETQKLEKRDDRKPEKNEKNLSSDPPTGAGKIVCGKCGMVGHMKTNRKKCPMYSAEVPDSSRAEKEGMVKMEGSKIKLSIDKIQQAADKKKEEQLYGDYMRPKQIPARRRRQVEENPYEDIIFKLIKFDDTRIFINPVKKEAYPDYYVIVKDPIDLTSMNSKAKRGGYASAEGFIKDLELLVFNSRLYNGDLHDVTRQGESIKNEGLRLLKEKELLVDLPECLKE